MTRPLIFPAPRTITSRPGPGAPTSTAPSIARDESLPAQGFILDIDAGEVRILTRDEAGERYARAVLAQLAEQSGDRLPRLSVTDWPSFPVRGVMLDVSRDRVPTRPTLVRYLDILELCRFNQLQLYIEHTFAFEGEDEVWADASPLNAADIRWLDDECAARGIELVPNQNTFGHMERFLATDRHRHRAEAPDGWQLGHEHFPASVLAPTEDNARFVHGLLAQVLPLYRSRTVNIGADETFELGQGVSRGDVARRGRGQVYIDFVRHIAEPLTADGYAVQYWADIAIHYPDLIAQLPAGAVPIVWMYEGVTSLRAAADLPAAVVEVEDAVPITEQLGGFDAHVQPLVERGIPFWVAPGTSTWRSLLGRIDNARENILDAARTGMRYGCEGILTTVWGDCGMIEPPSLAFDPLVFAGAASWNVETLSERDVAAALDRHVFADPTGNITAALETLGGLWNTLGIPSLNSSPLFDILMPQLFTVTDVTRADPAAVERAVTVLDEQIAALGRARPAARDGQIVVRELVHAARLARFAANELRADPGDPAQRLAALDDVIVEQRAVWLERSRPGGLEHSLGYLEPLRRRLIEAAKAPGHAQPRADGVAPPA